ncbi:hypothetical protein FACS1894162_0230 [Bacteroidia bacterium]|nr:hypothetical protein FACS1894162_0230 [Bacteroidia bacterium]
MKTLDLNVCGVSEMNAVEMQQTNGGGFWAWVFACFAWDTISNPRETAGAIQRGADAACAYAI